MADKIEDGGPAFPTIHGYVDSGSLKKKSEGLSLRDWFAGQALNACCTLAFGNIDQGSAIGLLPEEWAARIAYSVADNMLLAREGEL